MYISSEVQRLQARARGQQHLSRLWYSVRALLLPGVQIVLQAHGIYICIHIYSVVGEREDKGGV
jgi:hypothetical protein